MKDGFGREIEYMRISVTDRCNLRCKYCLPEGVELLSMDRILTYEQIALIVNCAVSLGITKFKITGGEPLVRKGVTSLIKLLKDIKGVEEVTLTTNGVLLCDHIDELSDAHIDGINISLDTLDPALYKKITGKDELSKVLLGIDAAVLHGIKVKINSVVLGGIDIENYVSLAEMAKDKNIDVRFIELMPIGAGKDYESVNCEEIVKAVVSKYAAVSDNTLSDHIDSLIDNYSHGNGPAKYYKIPGFMGCIGMINSIHNKFCGNCNRIRLTSTGEIKPCLYYGNTISLSEEVSLLSKISRTEDYELYFRTEKDLSDKLKSAILNKPCGHDFAEGKAQERKKMSQIGG